MAALTGCVLYNGASSIIDHGNATSTLEPPSSLRGGGIDHEHFVPPNRILLADQSDYGTITIKRRSPEDAAAMRRGQAAAARSRALAGGLAEETTLQALDPEVYRSVMATANELEIPEERRHDVSPYDIDSALLAARAFQRELLFFVYDSATDEFFVLHKLPTCDRGCERANVVAPFLARALRTNYPERFQGVKSGDLVLLISVGDVPRVRRQCLHEDNKYCKSENWAPILQFGSVLADPRYTPTAIAMPQTAWPHLPCFAEFQATGEVCQDLRPRDAANDDKARPQDAAALDPRHGLVFGGELGPDHRNSLLPTVVWHGADLPFLRTLLPDANAASYEEVVALAKDWFHGHLGPWVHYLPVRADLGDLKEKYDWAEGHPREARRIVEAGAEFASWAGSEEGFARLYQEHVTAPLGQVIAAYKRPRKKYQGRKALDILRESEFNGVKDELRVVAKCGGWPNESSGCRWTAKESAAGEKGLEDDATA